MSLELKSNTLEYEEAITHPKDPNADPEIAAISISFASQGPEWHKQISKKLLLKIDLHLLPWIVLMYLTNFLDRTALAQARLGTLEKDLRLKGTNFNTITSILFVGYIYL